MNCTRNVKQTAFWLKPDKPTVCYMNTHLHVCVHPTQHLTWKTKCLDWHTHFPKWNTTV